MGKNGESNSNKCCSVPQCKSRYTNEISLFFFPKDEAMRKRWTDATKIEKRVTQDMQVCSRHFVKNDYILSAYPGVAKVRRLKKTAVPTQNLPWQFPNKRVSPTLVKARMERLKNRTQQKTTVTPPKMETVKTKDPNDTDESMENGEETKGDDSIEAGKLKTEDELDRKPNKDGESKEKVENEDDKDTVKMASRAPTRLRERKSVLKCELCGRKCLTPQALRTHQQTAHKSVKNDEIYPKKDIKVMNKPREPLKRATIPQVAVKQPDKLCSPKPPAKVNKSLNEGDLVAKVLQEFDSDGANSGTDYSTDGSSDKEILKPEKKNTRKTEFECPKCKRRFAVYFSAFRHIQKHHSGLPKGDRM
ncbi:hypothetical protein MSG28_015903 [Choristoneura fumiferana]|uniref:Uncharacterized protein n=1 Tax=Choristoneura fumiferana TaxID=7141 RepID=A0ACC0K4R9_CHOFU|nr:hypothetical protein MSG28_015903 [Choristoneura fumiferana]